MATSQPQVLKRYYSEAAALGAKAINSDFSFEIEGFESSYLLVKQAPWPVLRPQGEIETSGVLGMKMWQQQQTATADQGQITIYETVAGSASKMLVDILSKGGTFNAKIYEGTPSRFIRYKRIVDAFIQLDNPDRDWENRSQVLTFSGTLFYHYFGEDEEGSTSY